MPYVYILQCGDGTFYVGSARDLQARLAQHQAGEGGNYTAKRQPVELVFSEEFDRIDDAYDREKQIQGWGRAKRKALIDGRMGDLPGLSRSRASASSAGHFDRLSTALDKLDPLKH